MASPLLGNPQDILTTPYGYSGQMSPETAVQEQALNRRRLIANMLMQQGLAPKQGRQAGRFFVAPNPLEHVVGLAQTGMGAFLTKNIDDQQSDLMKADRQSVVDAVNDYYKTLAQKKDLAQAPIGLAPPQPTQAPPPEPAPPQEPPIPSPEPFRGIAPRPEGPYSGEVGAVPMPEAGVQSAAPPIPAPIRDPIAGQENMRGLDMGGAQPADMSQFAPPATEAQPLPQSAPAPTPSPMPSPAPQSPRANMEALAQLMTHQHPLVQRFAAMEMQRLMREQERGDQREFMANENALNRDVRREGILENSRLREAQLQNTMALTQMQIDARMQQGRDANDLKAALAQQAAELQKIQMQNATELKKAEIGSRKETAKQHDETLKAIAQMNMEGRKEIAGMKAGAKDEAKLAEQEKSKKDVEGIIAVLRDSYNQLKAGGGVTDTTKGGLENMGAAASSSAFGQALGKTFGTQNQSHRNTIAQQRPILMGNISKALGMSAKQLDSNAELKLWLNAATDPTLDYQTNMRALDQLESMLANGPSGGAAAPAQAQRSVKRTGTHNGKKVIEYSDGSIEYAP